MFRLLVLLMLWLGAALLMTGCGPAAPSVQAVVVVSITEATIHAGDPLPAPEGPVVLTIKGKQHATGETRSVQLDMPTLEACGLVSMRVDDRFAEGREVVFQGVLLSSLLAVVGIAEDATLLVVVALNDTMVEIPISDVRELPVLLATRADGERMTIDHYGPLRIVYPFGQMTLAPVVHQSRSIWHVASIEIRQGGGR